MRQIYVKDMLNQTDKQKVRLSPFSRGISIKVKKKVGKKVTLRTIQRIMSGQTREDNYGVLELAIALQTEENKRLEKIKNKLTLLKNLNS